jgi:OTT_1508-like deaminase
LADWLENFHGFDDDLHGLCRFSYEQRACHHLRELQEHIGDEPSTLIDTESKRQDFHLTRHFIGRLGSHLKAAKILITAGSRMPNMFENFSIEIQPSSKPPSSPPPTDHMTTLDGIVKRMLPAGSQDVLPYQEALAAMDSKFRIKDRLLDQYKDKTFKPRVHAELSLLEFFYATKRQFVDDDRFIGCSKPACYCCYHYISLHPGGFVRPSSHGIRYINWRPPDLTDTATKEERIHQRDIMNKLIAQIRRDALRHIDQRKGPSPWHPDSTTGISYSQLNNRPVATDSK